MLLPIEISRLINLAYEAMVRDPQHTLAPAYRQAIYQGISNFPNPHTSLARKWLAVLAAEHVVPIWKQVWPNDSLAIRMLDLANTALYEVSDQAGIRAEAELAMEHLERLGNKLYGFTELDAFFAKTAAVQAVFEVLGIIPFDRLILAENETDEHLDPSASDTAKWAAYAYAGRLRDPNADPAKRRAFWAWWLYEGTSLAWGKSEH
jgi:hypothetical protein